MLMLAEDARDPEGRLLLPRGVCVDADKIDALRRRGAAALLVMETPAAEADESYAAGDAGAIERRLERLFRRCGDDDATRTLRECLLRYRLGPTR